MRNLIIYLSLFVLAVNVSCAQLKANESKTIPEQKAGIVKTPETAIKIAEVLWFSIYGEKIYNSKPFKAKLIKDDEIWYVEGTLNTDKGGVPFMEIQRKDCKILKFGHGK